ncbi:cyclic nucleotide-binding domain-containing protein [Thermodesulfobacteriota bacterium]
MMTNKTEFLSRVSLFSLLNKADLERIAEMAREHFIKKGDVVIREGDRDRRLFIMISGEVDVIKDLGGQKGKRVRILGPDSYFGEMALIDDLPRSASVVTREDTHLLSIDHELLRREIERNPAIAFELLKMLSWRIRAIEKTMVKTLGDYLPICVNCKMIRTEDDAWTPIEEYIADHTGTAFSHGICPECSEKLYPNIYKEE